MKLSSESKNYANDLHWKVCRKVVEDSKSALNNLRFENINERENADFNQRIRNTINFIESRIESYILAYQKEGINIDEEDRSKVHQEIHSIIKSEQSELFRIGLGLISIIRSKWSESTKDSINGCFQDSVKEKIQQTLADLDIAVSEGKLKKMLEQNKNRQYEVLRWLFDRVDGHQYKLANLREVIADNPDYAENELEKVSDYLKGKGLIKQMDDSGLLVQLTHKGIVEIQNSIKNPQKSTEHFPAPAIQNFNTFNAPVGSFQQGNQNIANVQQNFGSKTEDVINLLGELRKHIFDDNKQEGLEIIEGLEAEIKSEKPSESRMKLFLKGLGEVIKDTGKELLTEVGKKVISGEVQLG